MHILLTHEQADFDGLAALLGASLVYDGAIPVLPHRMNRNLKEFLNRYSNNLPFIELRDLPNRPIEQVTLVDTQALITLKGMSQQTRVHVVDHHPLRREAPSGWSMQLLELGACTTHFVEQLRAQAMRRPITPIEATLLLMGIYEDTGSLTYTNTTARDAEAVATLLGFGANLQIAGQFLNPPLSAEQMALYDELIAASESIDLEGQRIVTAKAEAGHMQDEISTVAHRLANSLDVDALLLLVQTREGIRLVARSTTDQINAARIAGQFHGGGHSRAAAALLRDRDLDEFPGNGTALERVYAHLLGLLPLHVTPAVTVGQIMSYGARLLSPTTSVQEASIQMQRYGYEGFPVVHNGHILGLLTRRAVDRAMAHHLNVTAGSLMDAGDVSINPEASVHDLQRLMTTTGWGQVPVVDPDTRQVIGIVTRTDLLQQLTSGNQPRRRQRLTKRLESALPPARLALLKTISRIAVRQNQPIYIVGGFVRDLLLERPGLDFDIVVEGDAILLAQALSRQYGGRVVSHQRFGTAKWQIAEERQRLALQLENPGPVPALEGQDLPTSLDLISARTEFYDHPTALPRVESSSIKLDLHRRDFSINTMALRLDGEHYGELYDFWGGLTDLRKGRVRVLHSLSFVDDPTRMLRAVRFEQRFNFKIEDRTLQLMEEAIPLLKQVSGQRLRHELDLVLSETNATTMLARLQELGLLAGIQPCLRWDPAWTDPMNKALHQPLPGHWGLTDLVGKTPLRLSLGYMVWLLGNSEEEIMELGERLRFQNHLFDTLLAANRLFHNLKALPLHPPSRVVQALENISPAGLYALYCRDLPADVRAVIETYAVRYRHVAPRTTGETLRAKGLKPGEIYGLILRRLRDAWLDGVITTPAAEQAMLNDLLADENLQGGDAHGDR